MTADGSAAGALGLMLALIAAGYALRRAGVFAPESSATLTKVILWIALPAAVLHHVPGLALDRALVAIALVPWLLALIAAIYALALGALARWPAPVIVLLALGVALGNTSFLGYPLIAAMVGADAVPVAVIVDQFGTFLIFATLGALAIARFGAGDHPDARRMALKIIGFPPFITLLFALVAAPGTWPAPVDWALASLAALLLPLAALSVGAQLSLVLPRAEIGPLAAALIGKLVVLPAAAVGLMMLYGWNDARAATLVLEAAMPTMVTAMALAAGAGIAPRLAAAIAGYGVLAAVITLPGWRQLLVVLGWLP